MTEPAEGAFHSLYNNEITSRSAGRAGVGIMPRGVRPWLRSRKYCRLPVFEGSVCAAGIKNEDRRVRYIDIAEVPDIRFWVSPDVFFLTTAYALHGEEAAFMDFLRSLVRNGATEIGRAHV